MMTKSMQLCCAVTLAIAAVAFTNLSARAFTMENLNANPDGNSRFADPDDQVKNFGQSAQPFGGNGPSVQFGAGEAPIGGFRGLPFGFQSGPRPPDPYGPRSLGNND
ncbi:MAG TPA: hypothetical protein VK442_06485 [Xanthobacteraceae bacterium]|nr:hypothetical protein [Xanthobacteraceae bacterium]